MKTCWILRSSRVWVERWQCEKSSRQWAHGNGNGRAWSQLRGSAYFTAHDLHLWFTCEAWRVDHLLYCVVLYYCTEFALVEYFLIFFLTKRLKLAEWITTGNILCWELMCQKSRVPPNLYTIRTEIPNATLSVSTYDYTFCEEPANRDVIADVSINSLGKECFADNPS